MRCAYPLHKIVNYINLILFIGVVSLLGYRYYLARISLIDSIRNSNSNNAESVFSGFDVQNFEDLIPKLRSNFLRKYENLVFFDYASNPLLPSCIIDNFSHDLHSNLYGNPHSESESAELSTNTIDSIRNKILGYFGTNLSQYTVLFTYSNFHSLKLLAESFPFTSKSTFLYSENSPNNILGLRSFAERENSKIKKVEFNEISNSDSQFFKFPEITTKVKFENQTEFEKLSLIAKNMNSNAIYIKNLNVTMNMLVVPLVDEFNGGTLNENEIKSLSPPSDIEGLTAIVVDATLYMQNSKLNLSSTPVHAVALSFEKMFGFPNIGALIVHNSFLPYLSKPYFGGGTLVYALTSANYEKLRLSPQDRFEDGSLPFLSIVSIQNGFSFFNESLGFDRVHNHVQNMKNYLFDRLSEIRYLNGSPLIQFYSSKDNSISIVTFNVLDEKAEIIPYEKVVQDASDANIYLVGGCFSTPGTCIKSLKMNEEKIEENIEHGNSDLMNFGAIRASVGWATLKDDIDKLVDYFEKKYIK